MKEDLKKQLNSAFYAPAPKRKEAFLKNLRPREISTFEMLLQQASYIRVIVWLFALAIIALVVAGSCLKAEGTECLTIMIMPFTASVAILESKRSGKYNMTELEMATRFSLRSVVFSRMIVLGTAAFVILGITSAVITVAFGGKWIFTVLRIMIPYLVTMIVSLKLERSIPGRQNGYLSLAVAGLASGLVYWATYLEPEMILKYAMVIESWGIVIGLVLLGLMLFEQWKTINFVEAFA